MNDEPKSSRGAQENVYPFWHNLVAGGFAGAGSRVATAPLDLIRIRRQLAPPVVYPSENLWETWVKIVENEGGITALFRGNVAAIFLWVGYSAVQFSLYNHLRNYMEIYQGSSSVAAFWAGATAGTCATLATYPFDLCRTTFAARGISKKNETVDVAFHSNARGSKTAQNVVSSKSFQSTVHPVPFSSLMEPQYHRLGADTPIRPLQSNAPPKTLTEFAVQLYQQKGIRGFYYGSGPAVLQIIPYMGLNFMIYDALVAGDKRVQNSGYAGALSGATSKILVYPIDTVKRRLQAQAFYGLPENQASSSGVNRKYFNMVDCAIRIAKDEGFYSFYRGLVPSVLKTTIATSLSFALFRFSKNMLELIYDKYAS